MTSIEMQEFDRGYDAFKKGHEYDEDASSFWQDGWEQASCDADMANVEREEMKRQSEHEEVEEEDVDDPWMDEDLSEADIKTWHDYVEGE